MNDDMQIFNNPEFGDVRTIMIDGEPWFVGKDVCAALGYSDTKAGTRRNVDDEDKRGCLVGTPSGNQQMTVINESGLYSLIFGSKLESAKKFKKWVTSEVLPALRKTGSYGAPKLPSNPMELLELHYEAIKHVDKKVDNVKSDVDNVKQDVDKVRSDLEQFKLDMPILGVEDNRITKAVRKRGIEVLGSENSNAYKNKSLRSKVYQDIYRELKRQFGVTTYKAIKRNQCDLAVQLIESYKPPLVMAEQINDCNAQETMEVA